MSVNSSSSSNDSLLHPNHSSIDTNFPYEDCLMSRPSSLIYASFGVTHILLLLPLSIFILYLGLQRWRQQRSTTTSAISHSDSFTYHMVVMELFGVFGYFLCCCAIYWKDFKMLDVGYSFMYFTWYGETLFHILTCVERYLAVVHPVTYLSLRGERGIRVRNISIGCVWLICVVCTVVNDFNGVNLIDELCVIIVALIVVSFCSLSVLCVLIRPRPGEQGGGREWVDQSKQRAFYTIVAILGVLMLRFVWNVIWAVLTVLEASSCVDLTSGMWLNLPCSLVLPVLFLHRAGTFTCCKKDDKD